MIDFDDLIPRSGHVHGFDSHVILRAAPGVVWDAVVGVGQWSAWTGELRVRGVDVLTAGARFKAGPGLAVRPAEVTVFEPVDELVWSAEYLGVGVRHGWRFEPYWHDDEDEDAPAPSCRVVHSLACFGVPGKVLASVGGLKELEDRFHRLNEDLRARVES